MDTEDMDIKRAVDAIMIRSYIDTTRLEIDVINHSVYIDGFFHVFDYTHRHQSDHEGHEILDSGTTQGNAQKLLLSIEQQIRGISGVAGLTFKFTNWKRTAAGWMEVSTS
ncbi:MAG: hypothetical protein SFY92_06835 [Verrucomicrobiae bacterium]|nr:hypothetical protein [Verrucomicrobiae bacterium]